jgi:hypothetical protein
MVMALGGGAFVQPETQELLAEHGVTVWLDCALEVLKARVAGDATRPLASDPEKFERLYHSRRPSYARADYRIDTTGMDAEQVAEAVLTCRFSNSPCKHNYANKLSESFAPRSPRLIPPRPSPAICAWKAANSSRASAAIAWTPSTRST